MELLRSFVEGNAGAFETIYRQTARDVYRWLLRIVRDRTVAEDLLIETYWRIYRSRATFDWKQSFPAWARRIATNVALDHLRRRRLEVPLPATLSQPAHPDPVVSEEIRSKVRRALSELPPQYRIVLMLALIEERPYREIAGALDIPIGTVKSRMFHAVRLLRRKLRAWGIEP